MVNVLDWFQLASNKENRMIQMRRYMHQYPEPSFEETWTHNYILNRLSHLDCEIESPIGRNGIKATFKGKENGPTVAFRATLMLCRYKNLTMYLINLKMMALCMRVVMTDILFYWVSRNCT